KIAVRGARRISLDETARTRPRKCVRGFVIDRRIRFHLHDYPGALAPNQSCADELARTPERIALKECGADNLLSAFLSLVGPSHYSVSEETPVALNKERGLRSGVLAAVCRFAFDLPSSSPSPSRWRSDPYACLYSCDHRDLIMEHLPHETNSSACRKPES